MWWNISLYKNCSRRMIKNDTAILTSRNLIVRFRILLIKFSRVTPCTCCLYEVFRISIGKLRQNSQRKILYIVSCFTNACPFKNAIPRKFNSFFFFFSFFLVDHALGGRPLCGLSTTVKRVQKFLIMRRISLGTRLRHVNFSQAYLRNGRLTLIMNFRHSDKLLRRLTIYIKIA